MEQPPLQHPPETPPVTDFHHASSDALFKRKRGRPAKGIPKTTPSLTHKKDEEDVCFICFDGGSLVLCDRRGCPKAYHPTCIKRDEAFFRSKAKWNCGWHICSTCGKGSHYMCYTCTYSLCKGCTKDADFVCVRGNKGLCGMCMRTIMLIENSAQGNKEMCEVDFDDKGSWEYLFKVYWMYLKEKLSLTSTELFQAKNPWKRAAPLNCKVQMPHELYHIKVDKGSGSENSCIDIEPNNLKNKKLKRSDNHRHFWDGGMNDVARDLSNTCETTGNTCITKNPINPNGTEIDGSINAGVVKLEASSVPADISSLPLSTGMEQQFSDFVNDKSGHYLDPTGSNLGDALHWKYSQNVSLPYNNQQLSLGASCVTLDNKENSQDGRCNSTRNEICANNQIVEQTGEQKVDDNVKDESVRSNGWNSQSPSCTIPADGNNNEGQSGNFERREDLSKRENSCHDGPHLCPTLPLTTFSEKLNENPSDKLRDGHGNEGISEDNGNCGLNKIFEGQSNSGQNYQKQSDCEENSGQSSGQNWSGPHVIHPPACNTSSWLAAIFGEPDESVSDLLEEVEKMESLGGLESPIPPIMECGEELTDGSITDCLSFANGLSPMLDAGKGDALSSTGDLHLPSQSMATEDPFRQADVQKMPGEHSSISSEVESTISRISWNPTNQYSWDPNC